MYEDFLMDAVREIADDVRSAATAVQNPVWMPQKPLKKMALSVPQTEQGLAASVQSELNVLLGFEKRARRENLIVRWSPQKRRDRVDQILVRELHSEEAAWTDFSVDETSVKDALAETLLETLVNDTVAALKKAYGL